MLSSFYHKLWGISLTKGHLFVTMLAMELPLWMQAPYMACSPPPRNWKAPNLHPVILRLVQRALDRATKRFSMVELIAVFPST